MPRPRGSSSLSIAASHNELQARRAWLTRIHTTQINIMETKKSIQACSPQAGTPAPAYKRQHWNNESPLDAMTARYSELKRMAKQEPVFKEFPELEAYMNERVRLLQRYGGKEKVPQDIVKAVLEKYKDVLDRYGKASDERIKEYVELIALIDKQKRRKA